jgi:hypothetical protein
MGVCKLYFCITRYLQQHPDALTGKSLEELASQYRPFAYIGARRHLYEFVKKEAENIGITPEAWFGRQDWDKDSGAFPDFVLAREAHNPVGNGALLELKDSKGKQVASFNSTLPSARKSLDKLTPLVRETVQRYEAQTGGNVGCSNERDCFYLVRTMRDNPKECRISVVQGTFFETIPNRQLLRSLWQEVLQQAKIPEEQQQQVLDNLAGLERDEIAQSRLIEGASVKPRLRIMSEVVSDANPHLYKPISARTVNLILKAPDEDAGLDVLGEWLAKCFQQDNLQANLSGNTLMVFVDEREIKYKIFQIRHRRNGLHLVVQTSV